MAKLIAGIASAVLLVCGPVADAAEGVHYVCADKTELTATFKSSPGSADLIFEGSKENVSLPQVLSADGGRYAKGDIEFWIKGHDATLMRGQRKTTCKS